MRTTRRTPKTNRQPQFRLSVPYMPWVWPRRLPKANRQPQSTVSSLSSLWAWPRKPARGVLKKSVLAALVYVDHYEDPINNRPAPADAPNARSVGLSYGEIRARLQAEYPGSAISMMTIRSYARDAKEQGVLMPRRRPYSLRLRRRRRQTPAP